MLRFIIAGCVDDGKSTLTGRLLYDSKSIFEDQMQHIKRSSRRLGRRGTDLSLLTDGLRDEREQGITIDVAYRYFSTPKRKFIIADAPGHVQYTRNMVTGASTADAVVILVDAQRGATEQTSRHLFIASLLGIRHVVFCVNKMDTQMWNEECFRKIRNGLVNMSGRLSFKESVCIPISAKYGDNVVDRSKNMDWYSGKTFLESIEGIDVECSDGRGYKRFPVQTVILACEEEHEVFRRYAGRMAGGRLRRGDMIVVFPAMQTSVIKDIYRYSECVDECVDGESVAITLEDDIDVSRGSLITGMDDLPNSGNSLEAVICWFNEEKPRPGARYVMRMNTNETRCVIKGVKSRFNAGSLEMEPWHGDIGMNDIAVVDIRTSGRVFFDSYVDNRVTGSFIVIDEMTNGTVAAGMVR